MLGGVYLGMEKNPQEDSLFSRGDRSRRSREQLKLLLSNSSFFLCSFTEESLCSKGSMGAAPALPDNIFPANYLMERLFKQTNLFVGILGAKDTVSTLFPQTK